MKLIRVTLVLTLMLTCAWANGQSRPDRSSSSSSPNAGSRSSSRIAQSSRDEAYRIETVEALIVKLNSHATVTGREESKSYRILFDAFLDLTAPPMDVNETFNQNTIHADMPRWSVVSGWAESNHHMVQAILDAREKIIIGLPYGIDNVPTTYRDRGIYIDLIRDGKLGHINFNYFLALKTISAFATAEIYRLMESDQTQPALDLALAHIFVLRQFCDRDFLEEKVQGIDMLSDALANLRDVFYVYIDNITLEQFRDIAIREIPFLRPDRSRLFIPEADRIVSEARIRFVFDERSGQAIPEVFADAFAKVQSKDEIMTRFGAAKRWQMIATIHGSLDASQERLQLIYDDWWRRWRIEAYDPILEIETEFNRCNPVRYAAVLYSMQDIESLFGIRNQLIAEVNGTAVAAGLCGYQKSFGTFPRGKERIYAFSIRKRSDSDPHDFNLAPFKYWLANQRISLDTAAGRLWIDEGEGLLYSLGQDHRDNRASLHTDDGIEGDVVLWPPVKALQRMQDLID